MTRDEAVALVNEGLSFRRSSPGRDAIVVERLQEAQRQREMGEQPPWFLRTEDVPFTATANVPTIALPVGFWQFDEESSLKLYTSGVFTRNLEFGAFDQLSKVWSGSTETSPFAVALRKDTIYLFPTPTSAVTLFADVYLHDDELLADDTENLWLANAPDILIADAGLLVAADIDDEVAIKKFTAKLQRAEAKLFAETIEREMNGRIYAMGSNN